MHSPTRPEDASATSEPVAVLAALGAQGCVSHALRSRLPHGATTLGGRRSERDANDGARWRLRRAALAAVLAVPVLACAAAPLLMTVPTSGATISTARLRMSIRLERHKHGQGFTLGYYEVRVQDGALDERHTMEVVRDEDWFGEMPLGTERVVQLLGVDARGAVRVRIVSSAGKPPSRDALLDAELPPSARALRPPGASRGNRSLHTQNGTLIVTESGGKGQPSVRVVFGELTGRVLDARRWKPM